MNEETGFVAAVLRDLATSTAVILAAWGALGGATNALTTRMRLRDALRHILLGGLIAAGTGTRCKAPAVIGWKVCRMHGAGGGAPTGPANGAWKHGGRSNEVVELQRKTVEIARLAKATVASIP